MMADKTPGDLDSVSTIQEIRVIAADVAREDAASAVALSNNPSGM